MNAKDITAFKRFLKNHGVNTMFVGLYKQHRYTDNPESVEQYLVSVPRNLAIAYAFDLSSLQKSEFGMAYWNDLDNKWRGFINNNDERKGFEMPIQEEYAAQEKKQEEEVQIVSNDWSGLNLIDIGPWSSNKQPMPDENEIRINTFKKNCVVLNNILVHILDNASFDTMGISVDANTNRMVLVFGKGLQYNVSKYSTNIKCINSKKFVEHLAKYLQVAFDPQKHYYVRIAQRMWNNSHTAYGIVLSQKITIK